jgi:multidrug efflux system membrane fusion protein
MNSTGISFRQRSSLLVAAIVIAAGCNGKNPDPVGAPPAIVSVARPLEQDVTDYQIFTARTEAVESVDVKARVTGELMKINFKDGDIVEKDRVLFVIDKRPYKAALDQAVAALAAARFSLDAAKASLEIADAALVKTQADYDIGIKVQKDNPGAISSQEIIRRLGARDEAKGSINKAKATIKEAESAIAKAEAAKDNAQLNYDWCEVKAPISGRINRHFVSAGNLVTQDATVLTNMVSLEPMWAYFDVDQNTALSYQRLVQEGKVKAARGTKVPVKMWPGTREDFSIDGVIDFLSNQFDANTSSIRMRARFDNPEGIFGQRPLVAGLFGRIRAPTSNPHKALLVNDLAIGTSQGNQKFVLVVNAKDEVEFRLVDVGQVHHGLREVFRQRKVVSTDSEGKEVTKEVDVLKPTDRLIVNGLQRVRPGATVTPRPVNMQTLLPEKSRE